MSQPHDPHAQSEHVDASDILGSIPVGFPLAHTHTPTQATHSAGVEWRGLAGLVQHMATAAVAAGQAYSATILSATISISPPIMCQGGGQDEWAEKRKLLSVYSP